MLQRLSIRLRLLLLSITLVSMMVGTNVYLDRASDAALRSDRLVTLIDSVNQVRTAFADLRYWMTDLAVSLLTLSETNADAARRRLQDRLDVLAQSEPETAAMVRAETRQFDEVAAKAVEAYTQDQRVIGNSLIAQARQHGVRVDALLNDLGAQLDARAHAARDLVLASAATAYTVTLTVVAVAIAIGV